MCVCVLLNRPRNRTTIITAHIICMSETKMENEAQRQTGVALLYRERSERS